MKLNKLNQNMFYNSFNIFNDELINPFCKFYLNNDQMHKYELFYNYVFSIDRLTNEVKEFVKNYNKEEPSYYFSYYLKECNASNYLIDGKLNFNCPDILKYCKFVTHLFIGEFYWEKYGICSLFLTINDENEISGFSIDNNNDDSYFQKYKKINQYDKTNVLHYDLKDELIQNLIKLNK